MDAFSQAIHQYHKSPRNTKLPVLSGIAEGGEPRPKSLPVSLVIRDSCSPGPTAGTNANLASTDCSRRAAGMLERWERRYYTRKHAVD